MNTQIRLQIKQPTNASHISFSIVLDYPTEKDLRETLARVFPMLLVRGLASIENNELPANFLPLPKSNANANLERGERYSSTGN